MRIFDKLAAEECPNDGAIPVLLGAKAWPTPNPGHHLNRVYRRLPRNLWRKTWHWTCHYCSLDVEEPRK